MIDNQALREYRDRLEELDTEISDADAMADLERAGRARTEREALLAHVAAATGIGGRARRMSDEDERARMRVSKALRRAIERIGDADAKLGYELSRSVRTGANCVYEPDPAQPLRWRVVTTSGEPGV